MPGHFRKTLILCCAVSLLASNAAQAAAEILIVGIGHSSCAHWLSSQNNEKEGDVWIYGYWSASNEANPKNHVVGANSDSDAILGETKKICLAEPSTSLAVAAGRVYFQFQQAGK